MSDWRKLVKKMTSEFSELKYAVKLVDFTTVPGPGLRKHGDNSGEEWCETCLIPVVTMAKENTAKVIVNLDGVDGFASSFLKEAFGGLVSKFGRSECLKLIEVVCLDEPSVVERLWNLAKEHNGQKTTGS